MLNDLIDAPSWEDARLPVALLVVWRHWRPITAMGVTGSDELNGRDDLGAAGQDSPSRTG